MTATKNAATTVGYFGKRAGDVINNDGSAIIFSEVAQGKFLC